MDLIAIRSHFVPAALLHHEPRQPAAELAPSFPRHDRDRAAGVAAVVNQKAPERPVGLAFAHEHGEPLDRRQERRLLRQQIGVTAADFLNLVAIAVVPGGRQPGFQHQCRDPREQAEDERRRHQLQVAPAGRL